MQESVRQRKEGLQFNLAIKFTSETASLQPDEHPVLPVGDGDSTRRAAGLSLRAPATLGASTTPSSASTPEGKKGGADAERKPVRSTLAWQPAPLLCKRLNVPVPRDLCGLDWTASRGPQGGRGAASGAEQDLLGPLGNFVVDSSASSQPKVCYAIACCCA